MADTHEEWLNSRLQDLIATGKEQVARGNRAAAEDTFRTARELLTPETDPALRAELGVADLAAPIEMVALPSADPVAAPAPQQPIEPPTFTLLETEIGEVKIDQSRTVPNAVIAMAAVPLMFFVVLLANGSQPSLRPQSDVKPDVLYTSVPAAGAPDRTLPSSSSDQDIVYIAPISAVLPVLTSRTEPLYTDEAMKAGYHGTVKMQIKISPSGTTTDPTVIQSPGYGLDDRALRAVMAWRFRPAELEGKAIPAAAWVEVHFREK